MGGCLNLDGRTLNLDGGTQTLDKGIRPPYNLSTGYTVVQNVVIFVRGGVLEDVLGLEDVLEDTF